MLYWKNVNRHKNYNEFIVRLSGNLYEQVVNSPSFATPLFVLGYLKALCIQLATLLVQTECLPKPEDLRVKSRVMLPLW